MSVKPPPAATHVPPASESRPSPHILIADDDACLLNLLEAILRRGGYRVSRAADGEAAWEILCAGSVDLLITDHDMPRLSGFELLRRVRMGPLHLPVILVSGELPTNEPDLPTLLPPGVALPKPYTLEGMQAELDLLLAPDPRHVEMGHGLLTPQAYPAPEPRKGPS